MTEQINNLAPHAAQDDEHWRERDRSQFQVKSYKWRKLGRDSDGAIYTMEKAFQTAYAIEGITEILRANIGEREAGAHGESLGTQLEDQLLAAVSMLANQLSSDIAEYAEAIDDELERKQKAKKTH
jgi:hypothetical protein